jgi:hypothetical protein
MLSLVITAGYWTSCFRLQSVATACHNNDESRPACPMQRVRSGHSEIADLKGQLGLIDLVDGVLIAEISSFRLLLLRDEAGGKGRA